MFLEGCDLPRAWAGRGQWRVLETGFGSGLNFLAAWRSWKQDPQRPRILHFAAIQAHPVRAPLAPELAAQCYGLTPGVHRLAFDGGRVLLTLCVGPAHAMLKELDFRADSVFLDADPDVLQLGTLKALARLCRRGTRVAMAAQASQVRHDLATCGFVLDGTGGAFEPAWSIKGLSDDAETRPTKCVVIGAGLAGAAVACSLARRGWQVEVLDRAEHPAAGASALPAGLMAPHQSPDDNPLSRLSRCGIRITLQEAQALLVEHQDWELSGALEDRGSDSRALPALGAELAAWSRPASPQQTSNPDRTSWWHEKAAWVKPAALVRSWLATPGIAFRGGTSVAGLRPEGGQWRVLAEGGTVLASAPLVVVAAAHASSKLLGARIATHPVRGQVSWGMTKTNADFPSYPVNGNGHFLPRVPLAGGQAWLTGSTYGRGDEDTTPRAQDHLANLQRLRELLPDAAEALANQFDEGSVRAWTGVRCASADRRPVVGELEPGLWVSTAMGSRGLTFAALCGELIAARLHGEPLPLQRKLADALDATRNRG